MVLVKATNLQLHYGEQILFDKVSFQLRTGQRLGLVGRNGVGKSTLLKALQGSMQLDDGMVWRAATCVIANLAQDLPEAEDISVMDFVAGGLTQLLEDLRNYERAMDLGDMDAIERLHERIEGVAGWSIKNRVEQVLSRLDLPTRDSLATLSGGWRRRAALARALVQNPDILLLDEPTNHLDIGAIKWLESQLVGFQGAIVFVTHDRSFLQTVANQIGELDRGHLHIWEGDYAGFLHFREEQLTTQARHDALFDKRLAQEEIWIRQGIKARRTRNEGRVRALKQMRETRAQRRQDPQLVSLAHSAGAASGKLVAELSEVGFGIGGKTIIEGFSSIILRGDKIGLLGPNGIGKSTLLKLILGDLEPDHGTIRRGSRLSVAYFDQLRSQLDLDKSALDNIAEGRETIEINGKQRHVMGYLQDFLFSGERARTAIGTLSGGERNRILLAKLFSLPSNLLVLDEPTNDLDGETLELLEALLVNFEGTVLLVSHDRSFLDNVVTSTYAFEGEAQVREYVGGYTDWLRQGGLWPEIHARAARAEPEATRPHASVKPARSNKLSYKLQRELDQLPTELEDLESEVAALQSQVAQPEFYQQARSHVAEKLSLLDKKQKLLTDRYARWEELELMREEAELK